MKNFFKDWSVRRILYLLGGIWMVAQAIHDKIWFFILFGLYFMAMAIFKFGCASGNCGTNTCEVNNPENKNVKY